MNGRTDGLLAEAQVKLECFQKTGLRGFYQQALDRVRAAGLDWNGTEAEAGALLEQLRRGYAFTGDGHGAER